MLIALLISKSGARTISTYPTEIEQQHVNIVIAGLAKKLSDPTNIDEGDIFVAYMLAMWSEPDKICYDRGPRRGSHRHNASFVAKTRDLILCVTNGPVLGIVEG